MSLPLLTDGQQEYVNENGHAVAEILSSHREQLLRLREEVRDGFAVVQAQIDTMRQALALAAGTVEHVPLGSVSDPRLQALERWEAIKRKLGGKEAEVIDVLMHSGPRTNTQLKPLLKLAYSTVCALTQKMSNMGFLTKQGDAWALREN